MTRMWANYGVQVPTGRWYLLCFPAFCFSGKGGATARRRKLKPDALDMRWIFLMLTVINSWNNRQGNLADPPRLELLIKAQRTWRKANTGVAIPQFSLKSVEMETFLQEESEREPNLPLPLSAGCRGFPALVSSTLWEKSLQNAFYFQHAWGARRSSSWEAAWPGWCRRSEQRLEHPLLLWKFKAKRDSCASAFPGEMLWMYEHTHRLLTLVNTEVLGIRWYTNNKSHHRQTLYEVVVAAVMSCKFEEKARFGDIGSLTLILGK